MTADGPIVLRWTPEQKQFLRSNWGRIPLSEIAAALGRGEDAVKQRAYKLLGTTIDRDPKPGRRKGRTKGQPR